MEDGVRGEIYARTVFPELLTLPPAELRRRVESDPEAWSTAMVRRLLDYLDDNAYSVGPIDAWEIVLAARFAARHGNAAAHVHCRVWKEIANVLRDFGRFRDADEALACAERYAIVTHTPQLHLGVVESGRMALAADTDRHIEARERAARAIAAMEDSGAVDHAYRVREYIASLLFNEKDYCAALAAYEHAAHIAGRAGSERDLARNLTNIGHCHVRLDNIAEAADYYAEAEVLLKRLNMVILAAKVRRSRARISVRTQGRAGWPAMEDAKAEFVRLSMAGEVCRTTVATMEEMLRREPECDMSELCAEIATDAFALGIYPIYADAIARLRDANENKTMTFELLQEVWDEFGVEASTAAAAN